MLKALRYVGLFHGFIQDCPCPPSNCRWEEPQPEPRSGWVGVPLSLHLIPGPSELLDLRQQVKVVLPKLGRQARG